MGRRDQAGRGKARSIGIAACSVAFLISANAQAQNVGARELIVAAKAAKLTDVDYSLKHCKDETRSVATWLSDVVGDTAKSIRWMGGRCVLARKERARDAGTRWCAHAVIVPRKGRGAATVEVYFERPAHGKPGLAFAFRAEVTLTDGTKDYVRETWAFEDGWKEMHVPGYTAAGFQGCD